jgi:hypothetical protein
MIPAMLRRDSLDQVPTAADYRKYIGERVHNNCVAKQFPNRSIAEFCDAAFSVRMT